MTTHDTTPRTTPQRILVGAFIAVAAIIVAVAIFGIIGPRYVWNARLVALTATTNTGTALPLSNGVAHLTAGNKVTVTGKTIHASQARIALRKDGSLSNLSEPQNVKITKDHFSVTLPQTADLAKGDYAIVIYLDGQNTIDGSINLEVLR